MAKMLRFTAAGPRRIFTVLPAMFSRAERFLSPGQNPKNKNRLSLLRPGFTRGTDTLNFKEQ